jgi:raffinose/stachyose/melibiose transport system substrate-binding protein
VLKDQSVISGFRVNTPVTGESPLAQAVQSTIAHTGQTVLWFEALFNAKATTTSQANAAPLVNGSISPQQFMAMVQADLAGP